MLRIASPPARIVIFASFPVMEETVEWMLSISHWSPVKSQMILVLFSERILMVIMMIYPTKNTVRPKEFPILGYLTEKQSNNIAIDAARIIPGMIAKNGDKKAYREMAEDGNRTCTII